MSPSGSATLLPSVRRSAAHRGLRYTSRTNRRLTRLRARHWPDSFRMQDPGARALIRGARRRRTRSSGVIVALRGFAFFSVALGMENHGDEHGGDGPGEWAHEVEP